MPAVAKFLETEVNCMQANTQTVSVPSADQVKTFLLALQQNICERLTALDGKASFKADSWERAEGGGGTSMVLSQGAVFEQAGVNFSHVMGAVMPASATAHRPELAGRSLKPWACH